MQYRLLLDTSGIHLDRENQVNERPSWDEWALGIAEAVAARSDCVRAQVGAVVLRPDHRPGGFGYNGSPPGKPGCESCPRRSSGVAPNTDYDSGPGRCNAIHAEANAILYCDRADLAGGTIFITRAPCPGCRKLIEAAGLRRIVWPEGEMKL